MKRLIISIFIISVILFENNSQINSCILVGDSLVNMGPQISAKTFTNTFPVNTVQFYNDWSKGEIIFNNGTILQNQTIRYNSYIDELIWLRESDYKQGIVLKDFISGFSYYSQPDMREVFKKMKVKLWFMPDSSYTYLHVLAEGKLSLLALHQVTRTPGTKNLENQDYYFTEKNGQLTNFKLNRVSLKKILPNEKEQVRKIIKNNNLEIMNVKDLILFFEIYNSL